MRTSREFAVLMAKLVVPALVGVLTIVCAVVAEAATASPEFFIETIAVEGLKRARQELIVSESLLQDGLSYTEVQLRDAVYRINRLPFVLEASFSLRKGSRRNTYELVITVRETERLFLGAIIFMSETVNNGSWGPPYLGDGPLRPLEERDLGEALTAGVRLFVENKGVLYAAALTESDGVRVGYTQYDLLRRHVFARVEVGSNLFDDWDGVAAIGIRLAGNHSLQAMVTADLEKHGLRRDRDEWLHRLEWRYDSTDDPVVPTSGLFLASGLEHRRITDEHVDGAGNLLRRYTSELAPVFTARRFHPVSHRVSLSWGGSAAAGWARREGPAGYCCEPRIDSDFIRLEAEGGVSFSLRSASSPHRSDLRWETSLRLRYGVESFAENLGIADRAFERWQLGSAVVLRNRWGVFRLGVSLAGNREDTR